MTDNHKSLDEYYDEIKTLIELNSNAHDNPQEIQFLKWALDTLQELGDIEDYELIDDGRDAADRWRVDAFSSESEENQIKTGMLGIIISLYDQNDSKENLTKTELDKFLKKLQKFVSNALTKEIDDIFELGGGSHNLATKIRQVSQVESPNLRFYIISNRPLSSRINELDKIKVDSLEVETHIWDLNRFYQIDLAGNERVDTDVDLTDYPISALKASKPGSNIDIYLGVVQGSTLYKIFDKWGSRLLEQNVRSFLGATRAANKGMRETIKNAPEKFIAFNNGISAIADEIEFKDSNITKMKNFQIVNGGQTSATVYRMGKEKNALDNVYVQMKLVIVKEDKTEDQSDKSDLLMKISRFSNTQSTVANSDFFSHHDYHRRMHDFSRRFLAPAKLNEPFQTYWYYERIRKQYDNESNLMTPTEKKAFLKINPKKQMFTKTELGKFIITFACLPHVVCKGGEYNFKEFQKITMALWDNNESDVNQIYFENTIAKAIIWNNLFEHLRYSKTLNITSPSKIGTYAISLLVDKLNQSGKELNFKKVWQIQDIPKNLLSLLVKICHDVHRIATDVNRPVENVDSYLKSQKAWDKVKELNIEDIDSISDLFLSNAEKTKDIKDGRKDQKLTNILEIEILIKKISPAEWDLVKQFLVDNNEETPKKLGLIDAAIISPEKLTEKQCKLIYDEIYQEFQDLKN
jgi:hypothetical protein